MKKIVLRNKWLLQDEDFENWRIDLLNGYPLQILDFILDLLYKGFEKFPVLVGNKNEFFSEGRFLALYFPFINDLWKILCIPENEYRKSLMILDELEFIKFSCNNRETFNFLFNKIPTNLSNKNSNEFCILNVDLIKVELGYSETKDSKIFYNILNKYSEISDECENYFKCFPDVDYFWKNPITYYNFYSE